MTGIVEIGFRLFARGLSALRFFLGESATVMTGLLGSSGDLCLSRTGLSITVSLLALWTEAARFCAFVTELGDSQGWKTLGPPRCVGLLRITRKLWVLISGHVVMSCRSSKPRICTSNRRIQFTQV